MLRALISFVCLFLIASCFASNRTTHWQKLSQAPGSDGVPFVSLAFFDDLHGLALSAVHLAKTNDGGKHWTEQFVSNTNQGFSSMRFHDRKSGWIVGSEGSDGLPFHNGSGRKAVLLETHDSGKTWQKISIEEFKAADGKEFSSFTNICAEAPDIVWITGNAGILKAKIVSGVLQILHINRTDSPLRDVACQKGEVWAAGDRGLITYYHDNKWITSRYSEACSFNRVLSDGNDVWVVGGIRSSEAEQLKGLLLKSGANMSWENKTPTGADLLMDLNFNGDHGWVVGIGGQIYSTTNAGVSWHKESCPISQDLYSIILLNERQGWIGGDKNSVLGLAVQ